MAVTADDPDLALHSRLLADTPTAFANPRAPPAWAPHAPRAQPSTPLARAAFQPFSGRWRRCARLRRFMLVH